MHRAWPRHLTAPGRVGPSPAAEIPEIDGLWLDDSRPATAPLLLILTMFFESVSSFFRARPSFDQATNLIKNRTGFVLWVVQRKAMEVQGRLASKLEYWWTQAASLGAEYRTKQNCKQSNEWTTIKGPQEPNPRSRLLPRPARAPCGRGAGAHLQPLLFPDKNFRLTFYPVY